MLEAKLLGVTSKPDLVSRGKPWGCHQGPDVPSMPETCCCSLPRGRVLLLASCGHQLLSQAWVHVLVELGHIPGGLGRVLSCSEGDGFSAHQTSKEENSPNVERGSNAKWPKCPLQDGPRASPSLRCW